MTMRITGAVFGLLFMPIAGFAQGAAPSGEAYAVTQRYETTQDASDGSSGTSSGQDSWLERVVARQADGVELEYDLPADARPEDQARSWQFPMRVLRLPDGRLRLLNAAQLDERLTAWLKAAKWDRSACGRLIFTWTAFRIECDPQAMLTRLEQMDVTAQDLREGASYKTAAGREGRLVRDGATFRTTLAVDPDTIRRERAEADVGVGELNRKPISLAAAMQARSKEEVSGSMTVAWDVDEAGIARTRTTMTTIKVKRADGVVENWKVTEVVERRRLDH
jgi:hypothetical protein